MQVSQPLELQWHLTHQELFQELRRAIPIPSPYLRMVPSHGEYVDTSGFRLLSSPTDQQLAIDVAIVTISIN